jgi:isopentenyl diphosphate isomerase/L-lactate dehydrogenase-like FMN-dependent dehydrogenase
MDLDRLTLSGVEALAAERVDPYWWRYLCGGAEAERTLAANLEAIGRRALRPRVLAGLREVSTEAVVLDLRLSCPVVVAPTGWHGMFHPDGEQGLARAAAAAGVGFCMSTFATCTPAEVAVAAPSAVRFYQIYVFRDHGLTDALIGEALEAGFTALFLTVDLASLGPRDRERDTGWRMPEVPNVIRAEASGAVLDDLLDPALDWGYVEHLVSRFGVPVVVKGILTPEDAVLAVEHGARGVVVSNHGGRQLDGALPTIDALAAVVDAVAGRLEVMVDGGFRRGSDVLKAVALGAVAVLVGRLPLWGLGAAGEEGARVVLELLRDEIATDLHLVGCGSIASVGRQHVR